MYNLRPIYVYSNMKQDRKSQLGSWEDSAVARLIQLRTGHILVKRSIKYKKIGVVTKHLNKN